MQEFVRPAIGIFVVNPPSDIHAFNDCQASFVTLVELERVWAASTRPAKTDIVMLRLPQGLK